MTEDKLKMGRETRLAMAKGAMEGPALLEWLNERGTDVVGAVTMMSWVLAYLSFKAPSVERTQQILDGFTGSLHLYSEFLCDMAEMEMAEQDKPDATEEVRH